MIIVLPDEAVYMERSNWSFLILVGLLFLRDGKKRQDGKTTPNPKLETPNPKP